MKTTTDVETTHIVRIHLDETERFLVWHHASDSAIRVDTITVTRTTTDERTIAVRRLDGWQHPTGGVYLGRTLASDERLPDKAPAHVAAQLAVEMAGGAR